MIKLFDVVGYTYDGEAYCKHCFEDYYIEKYGEKWREVMKADLEGEGCPIFAGDEWDYRPACGSCHDPINVTLAWDVQQKEDIVDMLEYHHERWTDLHERLPRIYHQIAKMEYLVEKCEGLAEKYPAELEQLYKKLQYINDSIIEHLKEAKKLERQLKELEKEKQAV